MPDTVNCFCACHHAASRPDPTHTCCTTCPYCDERIVLAKLEGHFDPCRRKYARKPAPETD